MAVVLSASGGHLWLQPKAGGKARILRKGSELRYGDTVLAGRGARAKFKITVPKGDAGKNDVILFKSISGAHHSVKVKQRGSRVIELTLGPWNGSPKRAAS